MWHSHQPMLEKPLTLPVIETVTLEKLQVLLASWKCPCSLFTSHLRTRVPIRGIMAPQQMTAWAAVPGGILQLVWLCLPNPKTKSLSQAMAGSSDLPLS